MTKPVSKSRKAKKKTPDASDVLPTKSAVAREFGVAPGTVTQWVARGLPQEDDLTFSKQKCAAWLELYKRGSHSDQQKAASPLQQKAEADVEWAKERAAKLKLERQEKERSLIPHKDFINALTERARFFKRALQAISRRLSPRLANVASPGEIQEILDKEFDKLLWEAYERGEKKKKK